MRHVEKWRWVWLAVADGGGKGAATGVGPPMIRRPKFCAHSKPLGRACCRKILQIHMQVWSVEGWPPGQPVQSNRERRSERGSERDAPEVPVPTCG